VKDIDYMPDVFSSEVLYLTADQIRVVILVTVLRYFRLRALNGENAVAQFLRCITRINSQKLEQHASTVPMKIRDNEIRATFAL
jgi:hypothetical protein